MCLPHRKTLFCRKCGQDTKHNVVEMSAPKDLVACSVCGEKSKV